MEDVGDGDDDDGDDDDDGLQRSGKRSRGSEGSKLKLSSDIGGGSNEVRHSPLLHVPSQLTPPRSI